MDGYEVRTLHLERTCMYVTCHSIWREEKSCRYMSCSVAIRLSIPN